MKGRVPLEDRAAADRTADTAEADMEDDFEYDAAKVCVCVCVCVYVPCVLTQ
jgi:hypothetical protein